MKNALRLTALLATAPLLGGCAGLLIDSITRSMVTDGTYSEVSKTFPPLPVDYGRVYIYRTEASTATSFQGNIITGGLLLKNPTVCTVDMTVYEVVWETFRYMDLPEGDHYISCGDDIIAERSRWTGKPRYRKGTNGVQLSVSRSTEYFMRVDAVKNPPHFIPAMTDGAQGRAEIMSLPYHKLGGTPYMYPQGEVTE